MTLRDRCRGANQLQPNYPSASLESSPRCLAREIDEKKEYSLNLLQDACDLYPLDLSLPDFVRYFSQFGAARWCFAFLGKKAFASMNVDGPSELAASLAFFEGHGAYVDDIQALRARMKGR